MTFIENNLFQLFDLHKEKTILFLPSNKNHVYLFYPIWSILKNKYKTIFLTQGSFKTEGAEEALQHFKIPFTKFESYKKQDPNFILKSESIDLVILGNDIDVIPQWFVNCSQSLQIPTILIQDGMLFDYITKRKPMSKISVMLTNSKKLIKLALKLKIQKKYKKILYGQSNCTQIHVWSKNTKYYLIDKNIDPTKIIITGNPKFQILTKFEKTPHKTKQVLYCPTSLIETGILDQNTVAGIVKSICHVITQLKEVDLIIKPHPVEKKSFYEKIICQFTQKIRLTNEDINNLFKTANCVITNLSTVSLDAIAHSIPVLLYVPNLEQIVKTSFFPQILIDKKVVLYAHDVESLNTQLIRILKGDFSIQESHRKEILEEFYGAIDSNAAIRSVEQIDDILNLCSRRI